jgi:1-acyl-sn-glycerol-3-phosphate acyltransferase
MLNSDGKTTTIATTAERNNNLHQDGAERIGSSPPMRQIPLLSEMIYFPVVLLSAILHFLLRKWPQLEATVAMAIMGGFFGLLLIPVTFAYGITVCLERFCHIPAPYTFYGLWMPLAILYIVQILILDQTHCQQLRNSGPPRPRYLLEHAAFAFADAMWRYFPSVDCIPCHPTNSTSATTTPCLDPSKQYIFGVHPHGIHCIPLGQFCTPNSAFDRTFPHLYGPKLTGVAATIIFKIPVVRELFFHMGYIDASRQVCHQALLEGQSLFICIGGEEEALYAQQGQDLVVLSKRKGFVRLALSHGASLVPVFGVGNTDTYQTYSFLLPARLWLQKKAGIALPIFHGRWCTTLPYPVPITLLVGPPIETPTPEYPGAKPNDALVDEYHAKYVQALKEMYAKHVPDRTLIVR